MLKKIKSLIDWELMSICMIIVLLFTIVLYLAILFIPLGQ